MYFSFFFVLLCYNTLFSALYNKKTCKHEQKLPDRCLYEVATEVAAWPIGCRRRCAERCFLPTLGWQVRPRNKGGRGETALFHLAKQTDKSLAEGQTTSADIACKYPDCRTATRHRCRGYVQAGTKARGDTTDTLAARHPDAPRHQRRDIQRDSPKAGDAGSSRQNATQQGKKEDKGSV